MDAELAPSEDYKPHLHLDDKDLPEIKDWSVGKEYSFTVRAKMTSVNMRENEDDERKMSAGFEIQEITPEGKSSSESQAEAINRYKKEGYSPQTAVRKARSRS